MNLVLILVLFVMTLGPSIVIAIIGRAGMQALGRNPSASPISIETIRNSSTSARTRKGTGSLLTDSHGWRFPTDR